MRINIKIDADFEEPEALITTACMTDEVNRVIDFINRSEEAATVISGFKDDKVTLLEQEELVRIYAEDGKIFAKKGQEPFVWNCPTGMQVMFPEDMFPKLKNY